MSARFHVPKSHWQGSTIRLPEDELYHARRVMRLKVGDSVQVFDGEGHEVLARIDVLRRKEGVLTIVEHSGHENIPGLPIILGQALPKGKKLDILTEDLTELGVGEIWPIQSQFCVMQLNAKKAEDRRERWQRIAEAAAKQCGRSDIPRIQSPGGLDGFLAAFAAAAETDDILGLISWVKGDRRQTLDQIQPKNPPRAIYLLIGPEGGFSEAEAEKAMAAGFQAVSLGPRILRTETAGPALLSMVQYRWGDFSQAQGG